jgi:hypothetical protein
MSEPPSADPIKSVVAEAPPVVVPTEKVAASLQLLDGDEIIQLSIRPSPWCIALHSFRLVLAMVLLGVAVTLAAQGRPSLAATIALTTIVLVGFCVVVAATLQWASRLYLLTNRRVVCFRGVFSVHLAQCGLTQVGEARIQRAWYEPLLRLGSIHLLPTEPEKPVLVWEHVARPAEVHEILVRAIQKAKGP